MILYLSGPCKGDVAANIARAWVKAQSLWPRFTVICPHTNSAGMDGADFIAGDLEIIDRLLPSDGIYMMRGWEGSDGAQLEHHRAKMQGLQIFYEGVNEP